MPLMTSELLPGSSGETVGELHCQLAALGFAIGPGERSTKSFGPSTVAAVRSFRERYGLAAGDGLDLSVGRSMYVASLVDTEDNRPVRFVGMGEGPDDLHEFVPQRFVDALLGDEQAA